MADILERIGFMLVNRYYVFVFFAVYLLFAVSDLGWRRVAIFTVIGYFTAFLCEFSSIRNGFPFGLYFYHYEEAQAHREIWIGGVPFWDSLSFVFLSYFSYTVARLVYSPLLVRRRDVQLVEPRPLRRSFKVLVTASFFMAFADVVIDPVTLHGEKWWLGSVYHYADADAPYFGVPIANFLGWALVGFVTVGLFQLIDGLREGASEGEAWRRGRRLLPFGALLGPLTYLGVVAMNIRTTFSIGLTRLAIVDIFIFTLPCVLLASLFLKPSNRAAAGDVEALAESDPHSPLFERYRPEDLHRPE